MNQNEIKKNKMNNIWIVILAFLGTYGMQGVMANTMSEDILFSNSIFSFFVFVGYMLVLVWSKPAYLSCSKKMHILAGIYSSLLSVALHFGARMEAVENVKVTDVSLWLRIIGFAIPFAVVVCKMWSELNEIIPKLVMCNAVNTNVNNEDIKATSKKEIPLNFLQVWAIIMLMWMPVFFALYPGAFVYDAQDEYIEVISRTFTMHHPLIHVLALGGIIHAAEYVGLTANAGIAAYVIIQMLIMTAVLALSIMYLYKWGVKKGYIFGVMVFYGLFPIFPMYGVCTAKDSLFTTFLFLVVILLVDYSKDSAQFFDIKKMILFVSASALMMLFRNNGVYAYVVSMPFIVVLGITLDKPFTKNNTSENEKESAKRDGELTKVRAIIKLVVLMLLSVAIYFGCNYILKTVTAAEDNEHQEVLTVPIQQLARTYTYSKDAFTDEDVNILYEVLPEEYLVTYSPRVSDILKSGFNNESYEKNPSRYRKLWLRIGLRKPLVYLNAWLGTSYGYWYPDAINNVYQGNQMFTFQYDESSYFGFETEPPGERDSKFPVLELLYRKLSLELFQQRIPVISMLFSPGFMFWIFAFVFIGCIDKRIIAMIPVMLLWLTVLLGPTTLVRYVLILWFIVPLYPLYFKEQRENERDK